MAEGTVTEKPRRTEIPRSGHEICVLLDQVPFLQARQSGDHRTYKNAQNGEIVTVLNKRRDLKDSNFKVYYRVRKTLQRWGIL